jgi:hypothetical protein
MAEASEHRVLDRRPVAIERMSGSISTTQPKCAPFCRNRPPTRPWPALSTVSGTLFWKFSSQVSTVRQGVSQPEQFASVPARPRTFSSAGPEAAIRDVAS